ncbi:MAG TPA: cupin domain-containing protein [Ktedonobacterales bacterium]|jgi:mannose-6-phosphate isomerase-like protein (cupin superfamily)|nr:cupin domain-containing protein [Ktedonobacterales bacterium]
MIEAVNLAQKLALFQETWSPKIVGELNENYLKVVKTHGEFVWHKHDDADELFLVLKGQLVIQLRDHDVTLNEGEFLVVPKGVEHKPVAENEAHVLLIEPKTVVNTGDATDERTVQPDQLSRI